VVLVVQLEEVGEDEDEEGQEVVEEESLKTKCHN
jgi:hypothetical protein